MIKVGVAGLVPQVIGGQLVDYGANALKPYPYFYDNELLLTDIRTSSYGIVISDNVCMRTLEPGALYSSYGYGSRRGRGGVVDPTITAVSFDGGAGIGMRDARSQRSSDQKWYALFLSLD